VNKQIEIAKHLLEVDLKPAQIEQIRAILIGESPAAPSSAGPLLMNQASAASFLGLHRQSIYRLVRSGLLPTVRITGTRWYRREDLERIAREGTGELA